MKTSDKIETLVAALAKASAEFAPVKRGKTYTNGPLQGKSYSTLDDLIDAVRPALCANGLAIMQGTDEEGRLVTRLAHSSGEWIETTSPVYEGQQPGAQGWGSGLTYARRYAMSALLNVAPDEDTDGAGATDKSRKQKPAHNGNGRAAPQEEPRHKANAGQGNGSAKAQLEIIRREITDAKDLVALAKVSKDHNQFLNWLQDANPDKASEISAAIFDKREELNAFQGPHPDDRPNGKANGFHGATKVSEGVNA